MAGPQKNNSKSAPKGKKMAPKGKKAEDEREETFQAVVCKHITNYHAYVFNADLRQVLTDSFESRFQPFSLERPSVCSISPHMQT